MSDDIEVRRNDVRKRVARELWAWGWYDLAETVARDPESDPQSKPTARQPHPDTMAGKK